MKTTKNTGITYRVTIIGRVDRPGLRCPSYARVAVNAMTRNVFSYTSQTAAIREMERALRGEYDTNAEHVTSVTVVAVAPSGAIVRTVRRRVERTDITAVRSLESGRNSRELQRTAIAVAAARAGRTFARVYA